jgi:hypothetical protein
MDNVSISLFEPANVRFNIAVIAHSHSPIHFGLRSKKQAKEFAGRRFKVVGKTAARFILHSVSSVRIRMQKLKLEGCTDQ